MSLLNLNFIIIALMSKTLDTQKIGEEKKIVKEL